MPQGKVKWFNNAKGYGFIIEDGGSEDLFAHFSSIQMEGYKTLKAGQPVSFEKQPSDKGIHAVNICAIEDAQSKKDNNLVDDDFISVEEESVTAMESEKQSEQHSEKQAAEDQKEESENRRNYAAL